MESKVEYMANAITHTFGDFNVTTGQLQNLTKDFTIDFLIRCMNYINQRVVKIACNDDNKEVQQITVEDHWDIIKFVNTLSDSAIGLLDLLDPKNSKKMKLAIKFVINYILFLDSMAEEFKEIHNPIQEKLQQVKTLKEDIETNKEEMLQKIQDVEKLRDTLSSRTRALEELDAEYNSLQISTHYRDELERLKNEVTDLKKQLDKNQEKLKNTKLSLTETTACLDCIKHYPELNEKLQKLEVECREEQKTEAQLQEMQAMKLNKIKLGETLLKEVKACHSYIQDNDLAGRSLKYITLKESISLDGSSKLKKAIEELEASIQSTKSSVAKLKVENERQHLRWIEESKLVEESKKNLRSQIKERAEENEAIVAKNKENIEAFVTAVKNCKATEKRIQNDNDEAVEEYQRLQLEFKEKTDFVIKTLRDMHKNK